MKTKSELLFERFLVDNDLPFDKIQELVTPTPDYLVSVNGMSLVFELKELGADEDFGVVKDPARPDIKFHSRTLGDHVRRRIEHARKQVQYGANRGTPSILLIYNDLDPVFQMFGTEDMDFTAAMYGEYTVIINKMPGGKSDWFNGKKQSLQKSKNTSFSAVGRLCDRAGKITITLFENAFAKIKIQYEQLPPCFEVRRVELSTDPLILP